MGYICVLSKILFHSFIIFCFLILMCQSASVGRRNDSEVTIGFNSSSNSRFLLNYREARRSVASGGLFSIVSFDNVPCTSANNDIGTCYTARECTNLNGVSDGVCAENFGVCCVITVTGGDSVSVNNSYFLNPDYPNQSVGPLISCLTVNKLPGATELYLEFITFNLWSPTAGICTNDTFTVASAGSTLSTVPYPVLCGNNVGQTEYIDFSQTSSITLCFNLAAGSGAKADPTLSGRMWKIRIVQFKSTDSCSAPPGCLQYYQDTTGVIQSFNFNNGQGELITGYGCINYCFTTPPGTCNLILTENNFMLPGIAPSDCTSDYLLANGQQFCGDTLGNGMLVVNRTSSSNFISISLCTDSNNPDMDLGFSINYNLINCTSFG